MRSLELKAYVPRPLAPQREEQLHVARPFERRQYRATAGLCGERLLPVLAVDRRRYAQQARKRSGVRPERHTDAARIDCRAEVHDQPVAWLLRAPRCPVRGGITIRQGAIDVAPMAVA